MWPRVTVVFLVMITAHRYPINSGVHPAKRSSKSAPEQHYKTGVSSCQQETREDSAM
jgi:hypothetical protein